MWECAGGGGGTRGRAKLRNKDPKPSSEKKETTTRNGTRDNFSQDSRKHQRPTRITSHARFTYALVSRPSSQRSTSLTLPIPSHTHAYIQHARVCMSASHKRVYTQPSVHSSLRDSQRVRTTHTASTAPVQRKKLWLCVCVSAFS